MSIINTTSAAGGQFMVTFDGRDLPEREMELAINAPGIPKIADGKPVTKTAKRITANKFLVMTK